MSIDLTEIAYCLGLCILHILYNVEPILLVVVECFIKPLPKPSQGLLSLYIE